MGITADIIIILIVAQILKEKGLQFVIIELDYQQVEKAKTGMSVVPVLRSEKLYSNPDPGFKFLKHDMLAIMGIAAQLSDFHSTFGTSSKESIMNSGQTI